MTITREELLAQLKEGTITPEEFTKSFEVLYEKERETSGGRRRSKKTESLYDKVNALYNEEKDATALIELCNLLVRKVKDELKYDTRGTFDESYDDYSVNDVLTAFAALRNPKDSLYPTKKHTKVVHTLNGTELSTNQYIIDYIFEQNFDGVKVVEKVEVVDEEPLIDDDLF